MAVQWNLLGNGYNALETLQAAGMAQRQRLMEAEQAAKAQQLQRSQMAQQAVASAVGRGDYGAAQQAAIGAGDFDLAKQIGGLDDAQRKRAADEAGAIGRVAQALTAVPEAQRASELAKYAPMLRQAGIGAHELQGVDLTDAGLARYVGFSQSINDQLAAARPQYQVIPEGGTLVNTRDPQALKAYSTPQAAPQTGGGSLEAQAQAAIAAGADPAAVRARLQQMQGGAPSQGGATFP